MKLLSPSKIEKALGCQATPIITDTGAFAGYRLQRGKEWVDMLPNGDLMGGRGRPVLRAEVWTLLHPRGGSR